MTQILVVDDSATMRRMVMASLRSLPEVNFGEAGTGLEALEYLSLAPIDLIILDMNMPDMHGLEMLKFVRGHQNYQELPIIVLTTRGDEGMVEAAMSAGASRYLTKPFEPGKLADTACGLLKN